MDVKPRHLKLIAFYSFRYSVRGGVGLVFMLLSLTFGLMVAHFTLQSVEMAQRKIENSGSQSISTEEVVDKMVSTARPIIKWVLGSREIDEIEDYSERQKARGVLEGWTTYLLDEHPALLSAILLILLLGWPFVVVCGAFDLLSGDVQSRGLRFQLIRADRASIYFGRVIGMVLTFILVLAILMVTISVYMGLKLPFYNWLDLIVWGFYGFAALVCISLPYIGLCSWVSSSINSPFASLTISSLIVGAVPTFALLGRNTWEPAGYVNYLLPWGFQHYLFHPDSLIVLAAILGCAGYTAVFLFLGQRHFARRDL